VYVIFKNDLNLFWCFGYPLLIAGSIWGKVEINQISLFRKSGSL